MMSNDPCSKDKCFEIGGRCAAFNLRRASRAVSQHYGMKLKETGLQSTQFTLLTAVRGLGRPTMNELSTVLGMDRTTLTRNLKPLLSSGYLQLTTGEDRRSRNIEITGSGVHVLQQAVIEWETVQQNLERRFGKKRLQTLLKELHELVELVYDGDDL